MPTEDILKFNYCISNSGIQKPITLDLLRSGDNDVSYAENNVYFDFVHI